VHTRGCNKKPLAHWINAVASDAVTSDVDLRELDLSFRLCLPVLISGSDEGSQYAIQTREQQDDCSLVSCDQSNYFLTLTHTCPGLSPAAVTAPSNYSSNSPSNFPRPPLITHFAVRVVPEEPQMKSTPSPESQPLRLPRGRRLSRKNLPKN